MNTNDLFTSITSFVTNKKLFDAHDTIIVGLSGGPDSVFLLHYLAEQQKKVSLTIIAAHLDHEWRPDSGNDVKFCRELTTRLGVPLVATKISELGFPGKFNGSQEDFARRARRYFFKTVAEKHQASRIALAHHQQDQQETFFIRLIRGASLTGLCGMRAKHGSYIRPLLQCNKKDIITYLTTNNIAYLEDPTNSSSDYLRNRIRHAVLPALEACDTRYARNFMRTIDQLAQTDEYLAEHAQKLLKDFTICKNNIKMVEYKAILQQHKTMRDRIILQWLIENQAPMTPHQRFFDEIERFLTSKHGGTHAIHSTWKLVKKENFAWIEFINH